DDLVELQKSRFGPLGIRSLCQRIPICPHEFDQALTGSLGPATNFGGIGALGEGGLLATIHDFLDPERNSCVIWTLSSRRLKIGEILFELLHPSRFESPQRIEHLATAGIQLVRLQVAAIHPLEDVEHRVASALICKIEACKSQQLRWRLPGIARLRLRLLG